ncbi:MAG: hypothetical protein EXR48_03255 [Dehalococcoidia bacterium]|nr:hypothetical protein [Dehalococcoidia bacterium]
MPNARTVLGDIPVEQLGITLPHEHIILAPATAQHDDPRYDAKALADEVCKDLGQAVQMFGLKTVVDAGPADLGRDVEVYRQVAQRLGVNVIASTGFHRLTSGISLVWQIQELDAIEDYLVREITEGVGPNKVKCGVIKLASTDGAITGVEEKVFRAAARASKRTGCPIITHTDATGWAATNIGKRQLDLLLSEGADSERVMIGHVCATANLAYLLEIVKAGCYIALDQVGVHFTNSDETRAGLVAALCAAGYAPQVLLSLDHQGVWFPNRPPLAAAMTRHFGYLHQSFLPRLRHGGVRDADIEQMTVGNPRELLGF